MNTTLTKLLVRCYRSKWTIMYGVSFSMSGKMRPFPCVSISSIRYIMSHIPVTCSAGIVAS